MLTFSPRRGRSWRGVVQGAGAFAATYTISFANVPPGTYAYYCTPHLALGMKGKLTINP